MNARTNEDTLEVATLGGGCFWCLDAIFRDLRGVARVESGYMGGGTTRPTYEQVCSGATGHAEVVRVEFDASELSYRDLLRIFFTIHDPTTLDRQGADVGTQYRSVIFTHSDEQRRAADEVIAELEARAVWDDPIVTRVEPASAWWPGEAYHQDYYARNPAAGYCRVVIAPKVAMARREFADRLRR